MKALDSCAYSRGLFRGTLVAKGCWPEFGHEDPGGKIRDRTF